MFPLKIGWEPLKLMIYLLIVAKSLSNFQSWNLDLGMQSYISSTFTNNFQFITQDNLLVKWQFTTTSVKDVFLARLSLYNKYRSKSLDVKWALNMKIEDEAKYDLKS